MGLFQETSGSEILKGPPMFRVTHRFHRNFIRQIPPNCQAEVEEVFKEGRNWFSWVGRFNRELYWCY